MVSKNQIKLITSLRLKKYREKHKLFLAEGTKVIDELYHAGIKFYEIFSTEKLPNIPEHLITRVTGTELQKISNLKTPNTVVAILHIPEEKRLVISGWTLMLDDVRDPGNLGTIIRLCDWFGIENLVCSLTTVDGYNSKVVQATMGSLARVNLYYRDLEEFLKENKSIKVYGAFMDGNNVYKTTFPDKGILIMGNEANGISPAIDKWISNRVSIPQFGTHQETESLNVATATAILLSELHRAIEK